VIVTVLLLAACGPRIRTDYSKLDLVDVRGHVRLDGNPVIGAVVIFEADDGSYSFGRTDNSGEYRLMFNSEKSGVLPGPKLVRISTMQTLMDEESAAFVEEPSEMPAKMPHKELIPARFNTQSQLRTVVDANTTELNFDLDSHD
jgi:hypothetical protein